MTTAQKARAIGMMIAMVALSAFVFIPERTTWGRIGVIAAGVVGCLVVLLAVPNAQNDDV